MSFGNVEELGVALKGTHVKLVDVRALPELVRAKAATVEQQQQQQQWHGREEEQEV